jgi:ABC-type Fe3+ transport system substrate-binding protein
LGAPHGIVYDPSKVKEEDLPKSYDELLTPKWKGKGKVALRNPLRGNSGAFFVHYILGTKGDLEWFRKLGENKAFVGKSYVTVHQQVEKGKYLIGLSRDVEALTWAHTVQENTKKPSKLKFRYIGENLPLQYQLGLVNVKAPHPAAARLFMNYVLSQEAVETLAKEGFSVGEKQAANLKMKNWQWDMSKVSTFQYRSNLYHALRNETMGGGIIEIFEPMAQSSKKLANDD